MPRDFSYELLAEAVPLAKPELQEALRRLVEAGLVFQRGVPPTAEYLFKHALVQALPPLDFLESHSQKSERSQIVLTNGLHFGAFDKSDEAMLNDYEELMGLLRTGEAVALDFSEIVLSFLSKDPASLEKSVEQEWSETPVDSRLVLA